MSFERLQKCLDNQWTNDGMIRAMHEFLEHSRVDMEWTARDITEGIPEALSFIAEKWEHLSGDTQERFVKASCDLFYSIINGLTADSFIMITYIIDRFTSSSETNIIVAGIKSFSDIHLAVIRFVCRDCTWTAPVEALWTEMSTVRSKIMRLKGTGAVSKEIYSCFRRLCTYVIIADVPVDNLPLFVKNNSAVLELHEIPKDLSLVPKDAVTRSKVNLLRNDILQNLLSLLCRPDMHFNHLKEVIIALSIGIWSDLPCRALCVRVLSALFNSFLQKEKGSQHMLLSSPEETKVITSLFDSLEQMEPLLVEQGRSFLKNIEEYHNDVTSPHDGRSITYNKSVIESFIHISNKLICLNHVVGVVVQKVCDGCTFLPHSPVMYESTMTTSLGMLPHAPCLTQRKFPEAYTFVHSHSSYTAYLYRTAMTILKSYMSMGAQHGRCYHAIHLSDIIRFSHTALQADAIIDMILSYALSGGKNSISLLIEVVNALYSSVGQTLENDDGTLAPFHAQLLILNTSQDPHATLYEIFLARSIAICMYERQPRSALQSQLFALLMQVPKMSHFVFKSIAQTYLDERCVGLIDVKTSLEVFSILTTRKPALRESIIFLFTCLVGAQDGNLRDATMHCIFRYLPLHDLYNTLLVKDDKSVISQSKLEQILQDAGLERMESFFNEIARCIKEDGTIMTSDTSPENLIAAGLSFSLYPEMHQLNNIRAIFQHFKRANENTKAFLLTQFEQSYVFLRAIAHLSTSPEFYTLLVTHSESAEALVRLIIIFISQYLDALLSATSRPIKELRQRVAMCHSSIHLLVNSVQQIQSRFRQAPKFYGEIAHFVDKRDFFRTVLPQVIQNVEENSEGVSRVLYRVLDKPLNVENSICPGVLLFELHQVPITKENLKSVAKCVEIVINLQYTEEGRGYVLQTTSIVDTLQKISQLSAWPVLTMRTLIQCLSLHTDKLLVWAHESFLPTFIERKAWDTNVTVWRGCLKVIGKYVHDMVHLLLKAPDDVILSALHSDIELHKSIETCVSNGALPEAVERQCRKFLKV